MKVKPSSTFHEEQDRPQTSHLTNGALAEIDKGESEVRRREREISGKSEIRSATVLLNRY